MRARTRHLSVHLQPEVVGKLAVGRVRALIAPVADYRRVRAGSLLWVAETVEVADFQPGRDYLRVRFPGMRIPGRIPWDPLIPPPPYGRFQWRSMPEAVSRWTLRVTKAQRRRLHLLTDGEAQICGVEARDGGWVPPTAATDSFVPYERACEALGHLWDVEHGAGMAGRNPEVVFIAFEAINRNIGRVPPAPRLVGARA